MSQDQGSGWGAPSGGQPPAGQPPAYQPPTGQQPPDDQPPQWAPPPPSTQTGWPTKYCPACGSTIDARAETCPRCGVGQHGVVAGETKRRPVAIVLALLLGGFGIHRFYLGNIAWGIAYLVFFWTGIPGFIAWLEALYYQTRSNEEWARLYGGPVKQPSGAAIGCLWLVALLPLILIALTIASVAGLVFLGGEIELILSEIGNEI